MLLCGAERSEHTKTYLDASTQHQDVHSNQDSHSNARLPAARLRSCSSVARSCV